MNDSIREHVPLAPLTTLGIGGSARYFIHATSEKTALDAVRFAHDRQLPLLILGGGSNLVVADRGFDGVVVRNEICGLDWVDDGARVRLTAGAGEDWDGLVAETVKRDLAGIECLSGIPGLVGGTPIQNVGAYGQEVAETIVRVRAYDRKSQTIVELSPKECAFSYRASTFNTTSRDRFIVLSVSYSFEKHGVPRTTYADVQRELVNATPTLQQVRDVVRAIRTRKAMLIQPGDPDCRSVGSFFKNPIVDETQLPDAPRYPAGPGKAKIPAAWLIEGAGFAKGYIDGRVGISSKHTLALINRGGGTAAELVTLARRIQHKVEADFGVRLVPEPVFVGFPADDPSLHLLQSSVD